MPKEYAETVVLDWRVLDWTRNIKFFSPFAVLCLCLQGRNLSCSILVNVQFYVSTKGDLKVKVVKVNGGKK